MKAHGIGTGGNSGPTTPKKSPVKKEKGASSEKSSAKKRKLEEVDENAGDEDEPIKGEVKSEIKSEDTITVKTEHSNGGVAARAEPAPTTPTQGEMAQPANQDDDDDEVLVISSTEKPSSDVPVYGSNHHHHHHLSTPAQHIPGIHSFDYAANMGYPLQASPSPTMMMPAMSRASSGNPLPYGFVHPSFHQYHHHDTPGFFWQGQTMMTPHSEDHHKEDAMDAGS